MSEIGSRAWVASTRGTLSRPQRVRFALDAVRAEATGLLRRHRPADVADVHAMVDRKPPDTDLAREVGALAAEVLPGPWLRHSLRTWLWGEVLGDGDGLAYDAEALHIAALLHDIALSPAYPTPPETGCFAVHGGEMARLLLIERGASAELAEVVRDAIAAHFNVRVPLSWGAEAHLLNAGAYLDVVGRRRHELPAAVVTAVLERHPREGFDAAVFAAIAEEAAARPHSRPGVLWRLGMPGAIRRAGFPEGRVAHPRTTVAFTRIRGRE
jgi:hypothetical protein